MPPHGRALRLGRTSIENQVYFLTAVTRDRRRWFEDFWLGCLCSRTLTDPRLWKHARLLAWVLMPDHFHLLVQLGPGATLPKLMQRLKSVTALEFGRATGIHGLWQAGYHDHALRFEEDLRDVARYLVANPVRAGLTACVGDYPFWDAVWVERGSNPLDP